MNADFWNQHEHDPLDHQINQSLKIIHSYCFVHRKRNKVNATNSIFLFSNPLKFLKNFKNWLSYAKKTVKNDKKFFFELCRLYVHIFEKYIRSKSGPISNFFSWICITKCHFIPVCIIQIFQHVFFWDTLLLPLTFQTHIIKFNRI